MSAPLVFFDIEASGLEPGGFPIEIGWVGESGQGESHLILPAPGWTLWSERSERVHGITMETLLREGRPHDWVARRAVAAFKGRTPVASAPKFDGEWLGMLLEAAGLPDRFEILDSDRAEIRGAACLLDLLDTDDKSAERYALERVVRDTMQEIVGVAHDEEAMRPGVNHRALADAERLWRTWCRIGGRSRASLARARAGQPITP